MMFDSRPAFDPQQQLLEQRTVMISGPLDTTKASEVAALLMTLDGRSSKPVDLIVNSTGGPIADALSLLDVLQLMRAPVTTTCVGAATGTAAAVVACGTGERLATARASFSLRCSATEAVEGTAEDLAVRAHQLTEARARLVEAVAGATGQPAESISDAVDRGGHLGADEALAFGLIDRIVDRAQGR